MKKKETIFVSSDLKRKLGKDALWKLKTYSRGSTVISNWIGKTIYVHNGHKFNSVLISEEIIGKKLGEFSFTRKRGIDPRKK